jgi:CBS domain-containing protein/sporulation protein YlmC with PRC-barrel domain
LYLSDLIKKSVTDSTGKKIGKLKDIIISPDSSDPNIKAITVNISNKNKINIPCTNINDLGKKITLKSALKDISNYDIKKSDIKLAEDVLDHQVVDVEDKKVKRVNDIIISSSHGHYHAIGIDNGFYGILKRFRLAGIAKPFGINPDDNIIAWENIDTLNTDYCDLKLKMPLQKIEKIHPADIAEIMEQLSFNESLNFFHCLDHETAADVLKNVSPERQVSLLEGMNGQHAAEILDKMNPDHAADVIGDSSKEKAIELLDLMESHESEDIKKLLKYPKNTAGGIMTTEYAYVNQDLTSKEVMESLHEIAKKVETIYYIYITSNGDLLGVVSLRDILLADPDTKINDFMHTLLIKADVLEDLDEVAHKIAKYSLLAIPVVENDTKLKGIITVDDVVDIISPDLWKKKSPKIFGS